MALCVHVPNVAMMYAQGQYGGGEDVYTCKR
jgi:hypothetical protein